jgi:hypothetical protein
MIVYILHNVLLEFETKKTVSKRKILRGKKE